MVRSSQLVAWSVAASLLGASAAGCRKSQPEQSQPKKEPSLRVETLPRYKVPLHDDEIALGPKQAPVTLVIFSNYACYPCHRNWLAMKHLREKYGDKIRVVHRSVNIPGYLANDQAVDAALAAHAQGKFWEMHWRLFKHAKDLSRPVLLAHAKALGLDMARFEEDFDTGAFTARRLRDQRAQELLGISAGPMTFVNGALVVGFQPMETWHEIVDQELALTERRIRDGALAANLYKELQESAMSGPIRLEGSSSSVELPKPKPKPKLPGQDKPLKAPDAARRYAVRAKDAQGSGPEDAPVVVVEFTDFQCPYCREAHEQRFEALRKSYGKKLRWESRQLPLPIHPSAKGASQAAWAAGQQGKFWPYHNALLASGSRLGLRRFLAIAKDLGLDLEKFRRDQNSPEAKAAVVHDIAFAAALGVNSTPTVFINGRYLPGLRSMATYKGMIDKELAAAKASGVSSKEFYAKRMADALGVESFPNPWPAEISPAP